MGANSTVDDRVLPAHISAPNATDPTQHLLHGNNSPTVPYFDSSIERGEWLQTSVWVQGRPDDTGALQVWEVTPSGVQEKVNRTGVPTVYGPGRSGASPYGYFERV